MKKSYIFAAGSFVVALIVGFVVSNRVGGDAPFPKQVIRVTAAKVTGQLAKPKVDLPESDDLKLDVTGEGIETVVVAKKLPFFVSAPKGGALYFWQLPDGVHGLDKGETILIQGAPKGAHSIRVKAVYIDWDAKKTLTRFGSVTVVVGDVDPGPGPGPNPPDPPGPAPIPLPGLRVLILYETADLSKLPKTQAEILYGKSFRDWLNSICIVGSDGKTREWRLWDKDIETKDAEPHWKAAMARPHPDIPWLVVSNGKAGFEGPLPADVTAAKLLIQKYVK